MATTISLDGANQSDQLKGGWVCCMAHYYFRTWSCARSTCYYYNDKGPGLMLTIMGRWHDAEDGR